MADMNGSPTPARLEGKLTAIVVCWVLGLGTLVAWNTMLTVGDYYYALFPRYHPARVLTLVYEPFALGTIAILAYKEAKIDTRKRNLAGFTLFFLSTFALLILDLATSGKGGIGNYIGICIIVAVFGIADAHIEGGMVGDLSLMCPEFIQSFFAGLAASGALTSALRMMTKAAFDKTNQGLRKGVILFPIYVTFHTRKLQYPSVYTRSTLCFYSGATFKCKSACMGCTFGCCSLLKTLVHSLKRALNSREFGLFFVLMLVGFAFRWIVLSSALGLLQHVVLPSCAVCTFR